MYCQIHHMKLNQAKKNNARNMIITGINQLKESAVIYALTNI